MGTGIAKSDREALSVKRAFVKRSISYLINRAMKSKKSENAKKKIQGL